MIPFSVTPSRSWTTPRVLHLALGAIYLTSALFCLSLVFGVRQHRAALKTVGEDATPSIIAAQSIKTGLADMDANVANELMVSKGQNAQSIEGYAQRRREVGEKLVGAAENITYGEAERQPIRHLEAGLGDYDAQASRARTLKDREARDSGALEAYRQADQTLHDMLFPAADALTKANTDVLDRTYREVKSASARTAAFVWLTGLSLIAALVALQLFLSQRMRRTFNPPLLIATVLTLGLMAHTIAVFNRSAHQLKIAREDAFTSLQALWQLRAVAYDANTDESRWLLDRANADSNEKAFFTKTALILQIPAGQSYESMRAATQGPLPQGAKGYLAQELGNITFAGEQEAAQQAVQAFGVYYAADQKIRSLEKAGRHDAAVAFCISMSPGNSNWAFDQFDKALGKTLDINQRAFDGAVAQGFQDLRGAEWLGTVLIVGVAALGYLGLRPRLREYR